MNIGIYQNFKTYEKAKVVREGTSVLDVYMSMGHSSI